MHKKKKPASSKKQLDRIEKKEDAELKKLDRLSHEVEELEHKKKKKKPLRKIDYKPAGGHMPTDFSIVAGSTGSFSAVLTPPNGAQAPNSVPQWAASDPSISLSPSGDGLKCDAAVPAGFTAPTFDLNLQALSSDANIGTVRVSHTITVNQPAPGPLTAIDFAQTA